MTLAVLLQEITPADPLAVLLHDYGWAAVLVWLVYREVWPFIKEHVFPAAIAERKQRMESQNRLDERQTVAMESMSRAVIEIQKAMVATNERLLDMRMAQAEHHKATGDAITLMRERTKPVKEVMAEREKRPTRRGGGS
jgi:hypothetical protein